MICSHRCFLNQNPYISSGFVQTPRPRCRTPVDPCVLEKYISIFTYIRAINLYLHFLAFSDTFSHCCGILSVPKMPDHDSEESVDAMKENGDQQPKEASEPGSEDAEKAEKPPPNAFMDPKSFPDGGAKAWLTVAGASACLFVSFGWVNCVGIFQDYYQMNQLKNYSPSNIAWIPALQSMSPWLYIIPSSSDHASIFHALWWNLRR